MISVVALFRGVPPFLASQLHNNAGSLQTWPKATSTFVNAFAFGIQAIVSKTFSSNSQACFLKSFSLPFSPRDKMFRIVRGEHNQSTRRHAAVFMLLNMAYNKDALMIDHYVSQMLKLRKCLSIVQIFLTLARTQTRSNIKCCRDWAFTFAFLFAVGVRSYPVIMSIALLWRGPQNNCYQVGAVVVDSICKTFVWKRDSILQCWMFWNPCFRQDNTMSQVLEYVLYKRELFLCSFHWFPYI